MIITRTTHTETDFLEVGDVFQGDDSLIIANKTEDNLSYVEQKYIKNNDLVEIDHSPNTDHNAISLSNKFFLVVVCDDILIHLPPHVEAKSIIAEEVHRNGNMKLGGLIISFNQYTQHCCYENKSTLEGVVQDGEALKVIGHREPRTEFGPFVPTN